MHERRGHLRADSGGHSKPHTTGRAVDCGVHWPPSTASGELCARLGRRSQKKNKLGLGKVQRRRDEIQLSSAYSCRRRLLLGFIHIFTNHDVDRVAPLSLSLSLSLFPSPQLQDMPVLSLLSCSLIMGLYVFRALFKLKPTQAGLFVAGCRAHLARYQGLFIPCRRRRLGRMGAGGRMSAEERFEEQKPREAHDPLRRVPTDKPPFTLGEIKKAIPPHCFQRSVVRSFSYVVQDLAIAAALLYVALVYFPRLPSPLHLLAWPLYWAAQGCVLTGVWVIAHECGHHAFSDYSLLDDVVGLVLHSALLVPYFSWKYSHRRHHSNTGSLERDEVFVPKPKASLPWFSKYLSNPPGRFLSLFITLTLGWPLYLAFNVSGRHYDSFACHYDPYGPIYSDRERAQIFISDAGVLGVAYVLFRLACEYSLGWVVRVYGVPLLVVNGFLVLITYLQHTHPALPHYDSSEWDWLRGALATVDRDYGVLNKVFHNITDTHVAHHLFSTMPHYNAMEATRAIKPILGEYYHLDTTPVHKAMWREAKECIYVQPDEATNNTGVFWYHNKF